MFEVLINLEKEGDSPWEVVTMGGNQPKEIRETIIKEASSKEVKSAGETLQEAPMTSGASSAKKLVDDALRITKLEPPNWLEKEEISKKRVCPPPIISLKDVVEVMYL